MRSDCNQRGKVCATRPEVPLPGAGEVTVSRFPCASEVFVVTCPSGSVMVSTSPKLL